MCGKPVEHRMCRCFGGGWLRTPTLNRGSQPALPINVPYQKKGGPWEVRLGERVTWLLQRGDFGADVHADAFGGAAEIDFAVA